MPALKSTLAVTGVALLESVLVAAWVLDSFWLQLVFTPLYTILHLFLTVYYIRKLS